MPLQESTGDIKVLVADDSPTIRRHLSLIINDEPGMFVVGEAVNGQDAVRLTQKLRPDIVSMDVNMPLMNGLEAVREIMHHAPTPIVIVSNSVERKEVNLAFQAIKAGALAVVKKPPAHAHPDFAPVRQELVDTLRLMSTVVVIHCWNNTGKPGNTRPSRQKPTPVPPIRQSPGPIRPAANIIQVVGLASSTGGPGALAGILGALPANFPVPIVIVQHICNNFERGLVEWLDRESPLHVHVARNGDSLLPGEVLMAPAGFHMQVTHKKSVFLNQRQQHYVNMPSADMLFYSLAEVYGHAAMGVILTGMGEDGASGLSAIRGAGGITLAQNEASSVVFGMPGAAIRRGGAEYIVSLDRIPALITRLISRKKIAVAD